MFRIPYMGSKQKIVSKIYDIINQDIGNTACMFATAKINTF